MPLLIFFMDRTKVRAPSLPAAFIELTTRRAGKEIYFDFYDYPLSTISKDCVEEGLNHLEFEDCLQYVALPGAKFEKEPSFSKHSRKYGHSDSVDRKGRNDMAVFFAFLRKKGVKYVTRVIVDDTEEPAHSDEEIENALRGLNIEIWNWRKIDQSIDVILEAAPDAREVYLYWSGNNAVLRGWGDEEGLKLLKSLEKVYLHVEQVRFPTRMTLLCGRNNSEH
jgi:hypothetical protein